MSNGSQPIDEFLHPKSMLTPGIAGSVVMLITNALAVHFSLPPNWTGLVLSFVVGLVVFRTLTKIPRWQKPLYYSLNSLIIFSVAMGANQAGLYGGRTLEASKDPVLLASETTTSSFFANWLDGTVVARAEAISELKDLADQQAKSALDSLGLANRPDVSPQKLLLGTLQNARTVEEVHKTATLVREFTRPSDTRAPDHPKGT